MKQQCRKNEVRAGTRFACCGKGKIIYMRNRLWKIKFAALCMVLGMMTLAGCNGEEREKVDLMSEMTEISEIAKVDAGADTEGTERMEVPLKDAIGAVMGEDFITGTSITGFDIKDEREMELVTRHFNAVTLGNELKPDAIFGYSRVCPGQETVTLNGEELAVPKTDFSLAEQILDVILEWNEEHPDNFIRVRGHVLVWHSQTPEWFFHENYDETRDYVDKDTMTRREEWYIKTVLEHFTGEDSRYRELFYGWDVVNEAVSDNTGTYRSDAENSSWWAVYGSPEYICNAFVFANRYAPSNVELYYNDYNEWYNVKINGIIQLLEDVKNTQGARIDGMGMQGHYQTEKSPSADEFERAARTFARIVGKVQVTELDMAASASYDGTDATRDEEFDRQAKRYQKLYQSMQKLKADGVNISGMTVWGVIDKYSWLQTANSVGGASDGTRKQCPLLFDDNYEAKPSYWVFVEE